MPIICPDIYCIEDANCTVSFLNPGDQIAAISHRGSCHSMTEKALSNRLYSLLIRGFSWLSYLQCSRRHR